MGKQRVYSGVCLYAAQEEWVFARGYRLYKFDLATKKMRYFSRLVDKKYAPLSRFRLTSRLFRAEITHLYRFQGDNWMCIAKKALFKYNPESGLFERCHTVEKGSRPMNLCQAKDGTIYYGEYCYNPDCKSMRIFCSLDNGSTWNVAYTFADGEINHIHGLFTDPYSDKLWVATGDDDHACIFGYTEDGFKSFIREYQGSQQNRVCVPLFQEDRIIFATDTQYEQNYIKVIQRENGSATVRNLQPIQGSGIYAAQVGGCFLVSTTVEPSAVNVDKNSHLWLSRDGEQWKEIAAYRKDLLKMTYFQFGSLRFPTYDGETDHIIFTGRALHHIDGKTVVIDLKDL